MANCSEILKVYNSVIRLNEENRALLKNTRNNLRNKMNRNFMSLPITEIGNHSLRFQSQGSYIMDTIITPWDDDFDLDDGVYFLGNMERQFRPETKTFHNWIKYAVGNDEKVAKVSDKDSCVRVRYVEEKFHIDLPIYYQDNPACPDLAHIKDGWILSGPIEFIAWFENKVKSGFKESFLLEKRMLSEYKVWASDIRRTDAQLRRIVRYLKGWGDLLRGDMPPGIIMTILAAENYVENERDDISLKETLIQIQNSLKNNDCKCLRPTTPKNEDLFGNYSLTQKKYFLDRLETFVTSAKQAIETPVQKDACLKWQKHFGTRFSCSLAKDEIDNAKEYTGFSILGDTAKSA